MFFSRIWQYLSLGNFRLYGICSTHDDHVHTYTTPLTSSLVHFVLTLKYVLIVGLQLWDVLSALEEITEPHNLGIYLGIKEHELEIFEKNYPRDIKRQKIEVMKYWLRNNRDCSWEVLANAVEKMGGHGNLMERLRDKHLKALSTTS